MIRRAWGEARADVQSGLPGASPGTNELWR